MSDLLLELVEYLHAAGVVAGDGVDSFRDITPPEPNNIVVLNEYAGVPQPSYADYSTRSVQILVRNESSDVAKAKCWEIFNTLMNPDEPVQDIGTRNVVLNPRCAPFRLSTDSYNRVTWCFNMGVTSPNKQ